MKLSEYLMKFIGSPYVWKGDGSGQYGGGFDCSGLVIEGLWALGILPSKDLTAQGIHDALIKSGWRNPYHTITREDDILFFGKDDKAITHVAVAIDNGLMVEAGGGGSKCKTSATSTGMVRIRPIAWRKDLVAALREP